MRKCWLCVIILLLALSVVGCNKGDSDNMYHQQSETEFIINFADESISSTGITLTFQNKSSSYSYQFDDVYVLEKNTNGEWCALVPVNNISSLAVAYIVSPGEITEHEIMWETKYGNLSAGEYRISKRIETLTSDAENENGKIVDEYRAYVRFSL